MVRCASPRALVPPCVGLQVSAKLLLAGRGGFGKGLGAVVYRPGGRLLAESGVFLLEIAGSGVGFSVPRLGFGVPRLGFLVPE